MQPALEFLQDNGDLLAVDPFWNQRTHIMLEDERCQPMVG
jgi:hypothetical protein